MLSQSALRAAPPPRFTRSPSPAEAGEDLSERNVVVQVAVERGRRALLAIAAAEVAAA